MGTPRIPNISHTANISVNAMVDIVSTRPAPGAVGWTGSTSISALIRGGLSLVFQGIATARITARAEADYFLWVLLSGVPMGSQPRPRTVAEWRGTRSRLR